MGLIPPRCCGSISKKNETDSKLSVEYATGELFAETSSSQMVCIAQTALPAWSTLVLTVLGGAYEESPLPRNTLFDFVATMMQLLAECFANERSGLGTPYYSGSLPRYHRALAAFSHPSWHTSETGTSYDIRLFSRESPKRQGVKLGVESRFISLFFNFLPPWLARR